MSELMSSNGFTYPWQPSVSGALAASFNGLRYQIAFSSYGVALAHAHFTPAFSRRASSVLHHAIRKMLDIDTYYYWSDPKSCGQPWRSFCEKHNVSMSQINLQGCEGWKGDPVFSDNVMYSAHLFKMMVLYQAISGDQKFSTYGWNFTHNGHDVHYTLGKLYSVIYYQVQRSISRSFPCEPMMIYAVCNSVIYPASRLYYRMNPSAPRIDFREFTNSLATVFGRTTGSTIFNLLTGKNETDSSVFRAVVLQPTLWLQSYRGPFERLILEFASELVDTLDGALGTDAWLLGQAEEAGLESPLFDRARNNLRRTSSWKHGVNGSYLDVDLTLAGRAGMTAPVTTAFTLSALGGRKQFEYKEVMKYFDTCHGKPFGNGYIYVNESSCGDMVGSNPQNVFITGLVLQAEAWDADVVSSLYSGDGAVHSKGNPRLVSVEPSNLTAHVTKAVYENSNNTLRVAVQCDYPGDVLLEIEWNAVNWSVSTACNREITIECAES
jgi:hypothetical protein